MGTRAKLEAGCGGGRRGGGELSMLAILQFSQPPPDQGITTVLLLQSGNKENTKPQSNSEARGQAEASLQTL